MNKESEGPVGSCGPGLQGAKKTRAGSVFASTPTVASTHYLARRTPFEPQLESDTEATHRITQRKRKSEHPAEGDEAD